MSLQENIRKILWETVGEVENIKNYIKLSKIDYSYHYRNNLEYHSLYKKIKGKEKNDAIKILADGFLDDVSKRVEFIGNKVRIYRAIAIPKIENLKNNLGIFWAYSEKNAQVIDDEEYKHDEKPDYSKVVMLKAEFNVSDIDWTNTFDLYLMNNWMEGELRVKKGAVANNVFYKKGGEKKWNILNKEKYYAESGGVLSNPDIRYADGGSIGKIKVKVIDEISTDEIDSKILKQFLDRKNIIK